MNPNTDEGTGPKPTHPPNPRPTNPPRPQNSYRAIRRLAAVVLLVAALLSAASCNWGSGGYQTCREAIKSSAAPLHRGDPGWNPALDRDGDGSACENGRTTP